MHRCSESLIIIYMHLIHIQEKNYHGASWWNLFGRREKSSQMRAKMWTYLGFRLSLVLRAANLFITEIS